MSRDNMAEWRWLRWVRAATGTEKEENRWENLSRD